VNEQSQIGTGKGLHVAIIMDGNGRWAKERGRPRLFGHHAGAKRAREVVEACPDLGVTHITLFAFSTENWKRTQAEVAGLMSLFRRYINKTAHELNDEGACVRFIGDPHERIREDHLRILRYYRFQARFGSALDEAAEDACAELAPTMKGLSRERVAMELLAILALPDPAPTIARMRARGVLPVILPEAGSSQIAALERLIESEARFGMQGDPITRLAALIPAVDGVADNVAARLRLSRRHRDLLGCLARRQPTDSEAAKALAYAEGSECAVGRLILEGHDPRPLDGWDVPDLPLKGGQIVARGLAGPDVSKALREVEARWIAEDFPGRSRVLELLDAVLAERD